MPNEREIIADEIERMMKSMSLLNDDDLRRATQEMGRLVYVHSSQVIAALRAKDREDGARSRAAGIEVREIGTGDAGEGKDA